MKKQYIVNTIEAKEINLEKEIKNRIDSLCNLYSYMYSLFEGDEEDVYPVPQNVINELSDFAKYFYELGLIHKGE